MKDLIKENLRIEERPPILPFDEDGKQSKMNTLKEQSHELRKKLDGMNDTLEGEEM